MKDIPIEQMDIRRLRVELSSAWLANKMLIESLQKLDALEAAGVDNWDGYDYAMELMEDENET